MLFSSQAAAQNNGVRRGEPVTLNFDNADITAVARTMSAITGRNVVVDPRVKGTITLNTERPVAPAVAYNQFLAALRLQGFTVVESAGLDKVVPEADAKLQSGGVSVGGNQTGATSNQIVTQIFRLSHENANNLVPILRPLISPNNTINVNPGNNSLVITDYADNLRRLARIIAAMDVANATDVEIIPLEHAIATDLAPLVLRLLEAGGSGGGTPGIPTQPGGDAAYRTTILAEPRSNALIVRAANPARLALVRSLVAKLDRPTVVGDAGAAGNIHVVYLKNADAVKLAATLRAAIAAGNVGTGSAGGAAGGGVASSPLQNTLPAGLQGGGLNAGGISGASGPTLNAAAANQPSTGGQIQADPSTNSLIITAPDPQFRQLRAVIDKLDTRRAQVFIESLIAEVNMDNAADFGIQWQSLLGKSGGSTVGVIGTNFGQGSSNIITLASQFANVGSNGVPTTLVPPPTGFNFGLAQKFGGIYVLGALANFLQSTGNGNVLSTPNLLTLDNEEARIVIGQNVPFVTGQYTNASAGAGGNVSPFQTVERKDVGLTLRVKPQISEDGSVKLVIYQEVSSVVASSVNSSTGLITNKRSIESSVVVDDGAIVVLGGLLQDEYSANVDKLPGLGDVPVLGNLFKSESRTRRKSNLMVFLRPVVVRDAPSVEQLSMDRYDLMRAGQLAAQPKESSVLRINDAAVLPQQPAPPQPGPQPRTSSALPKTRPLAQPPQDWWRDAPAAKSSVQKDAPVNPNIIPRTDLGMTPY